MVECGDSNTSPVQEWNLVCPDGGKRVEYTNYKTKQVHDCKMFEIKGLIKQSNRLLELTKDSPAKLRTDAIPNLHSVLIKMKIRLNEMGFKMKINNSGSCYMKIVNGMLNKRLVCYRTLRTSSIKD